MKSGESSASIDLKLLEDTSLTQTLHKQVAEITHQLVWKEQISESNQIQVQTLCGGITNALFLCSVSSQTVLPDKVVLRVFGENTDVIIDREAEKQVSRLAAEHGFGKQIFGYFTGGRVEEWISGSSITPEQMNSQELVPLIGRHLGQLHRLSLHALDKTPCFWTHIHRFTHLITCIPLPSSLDMHSIRNTFPALSKHLSSMPSPTVFAHNDLLSGNILWDASSPAAVRFIDFEYASYNYRGFDLANHFCECCGFECEWTHFPGETQQRMFLQAYLGEDASEEEIQRLLEEVRVWVPASHLFWGLWAIVQSNYSPISFDFIGYAHQRLAAYLDSIISFRS